MVPANARPLVRVSLLAWAGVAIAFAWMILTAVLGGATPTAHAEEDSGLLGGVTDLVDDVVDETTEVATEVVSTATTKVAAPVTETVKKTVAAVVPPAAPVLEKTTEVVAEVVKPVHEVVKSAPVSKIIEPVTAVVREVPVVGKATEALGVSSAVEHVAESVDETLATVGATTVVVTDVITAPASPEFPAVPSMPGTLVPDDEGAGGSTPSAAATSSPPSASASVFATLTFEGGRPAQRSITVGADRFFAFATAGSALAAVSSMQTASPTTPFTGEDSGHPLSLGLCGLSGGSSTGPGGSGPGAAALLAFGPLVAHRAWVRRRGRTDDAVPPAPVSPTDVSPD